jgi:hypothetical protein
MGPMARLNDAKPRVGWQGGAGNQNCQKSLDCETILPYVRRLGLGLVRMRGLAMRPVQTCSHCPGTPTIAAIIQLWT